MAYLPQWLSRWFGVLNERTGEQYPVPSTTLIDGALHQGPDHALQLDTVWACVDRRATTVASLPLFVYQQALDGRKTLARGTRLYDLLHDRPNGRMTSFDFWRALMLNLDLRGNGYARIDRDERTGEATALWPMAADQVRQFLLPDGTVTYEYRVGDSVAVLAAESVLHLKGLGNGTTGMSKLDFMTAALTEAAHSQTSATKMFGSAGKPTGALMIDKVLTPDQRTSIQQRFREMGEGSVARLYVLEANMKYQQLSLSPEQQQLLETRQFGVENLCRWFDVPPVLVHHAAGVTYNGAEQVIDAWHKLSIRPLLVCIEQAIRQQVMTSAQRARMVAEFNHDALLRGSLKDRLAAYATAVQNGIKTRNECRQLENDEPKPGGDALTAQTNLAPLEMLGRITGGGANAASEAPVAQ
jgi:HK97 family phage portal protein